MGRLVSLAPSVTSTVESLGAGDRLAGVTAHCDVDEIPVLGGWLSPDFDRIAAVDPDLVLTADALQREISDTLRDRGYRVFHHEPATLEDVLEGFAAVGVAIGMPTAGRELAGRARARIDRVRAHTADRTTDRPIVYCEEWPDPPMAAGNWIPEAVEAAGGHYPFVEAGERSGPIDRETVIAAAPAHVVVHHCGFGERARDDVAERWGLDASVHVIDDALLNQPGTRLVDGIERLAELFQRIEPPPSPFST